MATVVLQYAGAAVGTMLGGPVGSMIGRAAGAIAGSLIDNRLMGGSTKRIEGSRLNDLRVMSSEEGAPIPRLWGRMRIPGQVIWATNYEEVAVTTTNKASSKGGSGDGGSSTTKITEYSYYANFAIGLCEGEIERIGRVWADGKEIDLKAYTTRLYHGSENQLPDGLIIAKEGSNNAPAYRGLAYIVFERLPLRQFGNRLPQLSFEIIATGASAADDIRAVNIIPGSTEFGYDTQVVTRDAGAGVTISENAHASADITDWTISLNDLQGQCRNLKAASLVVAWFGTDLRCGHCKIMPGVDRRDKKTTPDDWSVSGISRNSAHIMSTVNDRAVYGGTPSDASVIRALQDLRRRGLKAVFYPFILMDIAVDNNLPDLYGGMTQPTYPWRGRISCNPAPNMPGTVDKTSDAAQQVELFLGSANPAQFTINGSNVIYSGPPEWGYRRMILHYAKLCAAAGGVDGFIIGSELRGLTTLRSSMTDFPFVNALVTLAREVKAILPTAKITYAADWSEYSTYIPADDSNNLYFHLDPLWSSSAIEAIGIDNYMPLSDWRDGINHLDHHAGYSSIYDQTYLQAGIAGGEGYDWYYATEEDRQKQQRAPISDGAYNKPWVYRYKDIYSWWSNRHYNRINGIEQSKSSQWIPGSKPIWFTETGCPAINKGSNQPNAFYDIKTSESSLPYFSNGSRDDLMQARFVSAISSYWRKAGDHNPNSIFYEGRMVDPDRIFIWAWDARPYPIFPERNDIWSDGENYSRGHWLNARIGALDVGGLAVAISHSYGLATTEVTTATGLIDGYMIERPMSGRDALESLLAAFTLDAVESEGKLKFRSRRQHAQRAIFTDQLVEIKKDEGLYSINRAQETDLPCSIKLSYTETLSDYRSAIVEAQKQGTRTARQLVVELPCATSQSIARQRADVLLQEKWSGRESISFALPLSQMDLEPGDVIRWGPYTLRINHIQDGAYRKLEASSYEVSTYDPPPAKDRETNPFVVSVFGKPDIVMMDLAMSVTSNALSPWLAAQAAPWPGRLNILKRNSIASLEFNRSLDMQATMGSLLTSLIRGPCHIFDEANSFDVEMKYGALASATKIEVLNGANLAAIGDEATGYEIIQFGRAVLIAPNRYRVSQLLRAQAGSLPEMLDKRAAGENFILLNSAVVQAELSLSEAAGESRWRIGPAQNDAAHPSYLDMVTTSFKRGLRPLPPCQLKARYHGDDIVISWIRRTRCDGDSWDLREVPLAEDKEAYKLQIGSPTTVYRQLELTNPEYHYQAQDIAADFGQRPSSLCVKVAQYSNSYGLGPQTIRIVNV